MTLAQRLFREPALILGVLTAGLALLVLFGVELTNEQTGGIGLFVAALIALLRFLTTPANEVVVQEKPSGEVVAGPAAATPTGTPVAVELSPAA